MVVTSAGVVVYFDGSEKVDIKVPEEYLTTEDANHRLVGLCGNLDGNPDNDMMDYQGKTAYTDADEFAAGYIEGSSCKENNQPGQCYL